MKRIFTKALCLVCAGALALSLAACGGKADSTASSTASSSALGSASDYDYQNFNYSDGLDEKGYWEGIRALDYVTLPEDFASVAIKRSDVEPTSEEVEEQISDLLSQYSSTEHITDRAAADGDTVNINYVGSVNNVEFTGGSAENYDLTLGSGTFIDGFEDQIIGHKPGETFDVNVTFPDGYSDSTDASGNAVKLSGQKAVFTVTLNYISESVLPKLTDSWVADTFGTPNNIYTVEALRAYYQNQLYTSNLNTAVMDDLMENSTFKSIPQQVMDYQVNQCLNYYSTLAGYYGYDLDGLVQNLLGYESTDDMLAHLESSLEDYSKEALLYQAVAESLDITPTQEQLDAMEVLLKKMDQAEDDASFAEMDIAFHGMIVDAADSPSLKRAWDNLRLVEWTSVSVAVTQESLPELAEQHWQIFRTLRSHAEQEAGAYMFLHIKHFGEELKRYVTETEQAEAVPQEREERRLS